MMPLVLAALLVFFPDHITAPFCPNQLRDGDEHLVAINWQQHAPEFNALVLQAFNAASDNLPRLLQQAPKNSKLAIITDIDETLIDSSAYFSHIHATGQQDSAELLARWWSEQKMRALPGAVSFLREASRQGIEIFYVSGRFNSHREITLKKMKELGFPVSNVDQLLFQQNVGEILSKAGRRQQVIDRGYHILLLLGDQLADLDEVTTESKLQEHEWLNRNIYRFGDTWYMFPNVIYGPWIWEANRRYKQMLVEKEQSDNDERSSSDSRPHPILDLVDSREQTSAALWVHTTTEFKTLCLQAFNLASRRLATLDPESDKPSAVVIHINGSVLSYLAPGSIRRGTVDQARLHKQLEENPLLPGVIDFLQDAERKGYDIFYLSDTQLSSGTSGNDHDLERTVVSRLQALGLPNADATHVISTDERSCKTEKWGHCSSHSTQGATTRELIEGTTHRIALTVSDHLGAFVPAGEIDLRQRTLPNSVKERLGREFIIIPNPLNQQSLNAMYQSFSESPLDTLSESELRNLRFRLIKRTSDNATEEGTTDPQQQFSYDSPQGEEIDTKFGSVELSL